MSWLAPLLGALIAATGLHHVAPVLRVAARAPQHSGALIARPAPTPTPAPSATPVAPAPTPTPTPTATPGYPSRDGVDFDDRDGYVLRPAYKVLQAGQVEFLPVNFGMDAHNLTVDSTAGRNYGEIDLPADGQTYSLKLSLPPGSYRLYCSLLDHAARGMDTTITVSGP